jgi:hypothetical protein
MIILRQYNYSEHEKLYEEWKKNKDPETAYKWSQAYNKAYDKHKTLPEPDPEILKSVDEYIKQKDPKEHKTMTEWNNAVKGYWSGKNYKLSPETAEHVKKATKEAGITEKIINKADKK